MKFTRMLLVWWILLRLPGIFSLSNPNNRTATDGTQTSVNTGLGESSRSNEAVNNNTDASAGGASSTQAESEVSTLGSVSESTTSSSHAQDRHSRYQRVSTSTKIAASWSKEHEKGCSHAKFTKSFFAMSKMPKK